MSLLEIDKLESETKPWDFIKRLIIEEVTSRMSDKTYSEVVWESRDWPRILKRPERNIVYYMKTYNGELYIRIKDRKKAVTGIYGYGYRCLDRFDGLLRSPLPLSIEEILIKNGHELT